MAEKPPAFVVVDKRKFTAEGEIREGFTPPEPEPPRAAAPEQPRPADEDLSSAKVVTMPARTPQAAASATGAADDLSDEDMAGSLEAVESIGADDFDGLDPELASLASIGELDGEEPIGEPRTAAETAEQHAAYQQSTRELDKMLQQANPGMQSPGVIGFAHVIQSFYLSAIMAMGAGAEPGEKPRIDILGARQSIDMLAVLEEKTRGNLSAEEQQLLQGITFELRMMFLELTNAISKQAHQPPPGPPLGGRGPR